MANERTLTLQEFLAAVNLDIRRELHFADECLEQAGLWRGKDPSFASAQFLRLAATAMCNATTLAAEVLAAGGTPPAGRQHGRRLVPHWPGTRRRPVRLRQAVRNYRRRWRAAQRLGLFRLAEVFLEIVWTERSQWNRMLLLAGRERRREDGTGRGIAGLTLGDRLWRR